MIVNGINCRWVTVREINTAVPLLLLFGACLEGMVRSDYTYLSPGPLSLSPGSNTWAHSTEQPFSLSAVTLISPLLGSDCLSCLSLLVLLCPELYSIPPLSFSHSLTHTIINRALLVYQYAMNRPGPAAPALLKSLSVWKKHMVPGCSQCPSVSSGISKLCFSSLQ